MRNSLIIITSLLVLVSCRHIEQQEHFVKEPTLESLEKYSTSTFTDAFFNEKQFGYADSYVDSNSIYRMNQIESSKLADSTKIYYTAAVNIFENTVINYNRKCRARLINDSLFLDFSDSPFSLSIFEVKIVKVNNKYISELSQTISMTDSSYIPPKYNLIKETILLDKPNYRNGDLLKGKFILQFQAHHSWEKPFTDTVNIYGFIKTTIE